MPYSDLSLPSGEELLKKHNAEQLKYFKLNQDLNELIIYPPSNIPGIVSQKTPVIYKKTKFPVGDSIVELYTKNGEFDFFMWHTTGNKIQVARRWGILADYSITSKVLRAIGQDRLIELERISEGYIGNRYAMETSLLDLYQDRIEPLCEIESIINQSNTPRQLKIAFDSYIAALKKIKRNLAQRFADNELATFDSDALNQISVSLEHDIMLAQQTLKQYMASTSTLEQAQQSTGSASALTFVKTQIIRNLHEFLNISQNVSYSPVMPFALTRGELNSCIEYALRQVKDHEAPRHDVINTDHHGNYGDETILVAYDSSRQGLTPSQQKLALKAITFIEEVNSADVNKLNVQIIKAVNWGITDSYKVSFKKAAVWLANIGIKLTAGIPDLLTLGLIEPLRKMAIYEIKIQNPQVVELNGAELFEKATLPRISLGQRVRQILGNAFRNSVQDIWYGVRDIHREFTVHLFDNINNDYADGNVESPSLFDVMQIMGAEIEKINSLNAQHIKKINHSYGSAPPFFPLQKGQDRGERFAEPEAIPTTGKLYDPLNAGARGFQAVMDFYLGNIHAQHKFLGLAFSCTYLAGSLSILAPHYVTFLGAKYINFSRTLGYGMAHSKATAAMSSGCTQAQLVSAALELGMKGSRSWLATAANRFGEDPATSIIYISTAIGLGYAIAFKLNIPWLSEHLRHDLGHFPPSALGFAGAKLSILVKELFEEHARIDFDVTVLTNKIKQFLIDEYKRSEVYKNTSPVQTDAKIQDIVAETLTVLLNEGNIVQLKNAYQLLNSEESIQHMRLIIKNLLCETDDESKQEFNRAYMAIIFEENEKNLAYLSEKTKHLVINQIKQNFSRQQALSLKNAFYPDDTASILRTTLGILIGYISFPLRIVCAIGSSIIQKNRQPVLSAGEEFALKMAKDVTRVIYAASKVVKAALVFPYIHCKAVGDVVINSFLGRLQAFLTNKHSIAASGYAGFAAVEVAYEHARQYVSMPVDVAMNFVTAPGSVDTLRKAESSYANILRKMPVDVPSNPATRGSSLTQDNRGMQKHQGISRGNSISSLEVTGSEKGNAELWLDEHSSATVAEYSPTSSTRIMS
jgi:hypothetical protein